MPCELNIVASLSDQNSDGLTLPEKAFSRNSFETHPYDFDMLVSVDRERPRVYIVLSFVIPPDIGVSQLASLSLTYQNHCDRVLVHHGVNKPTNLECLPGRGMISPYLPKKPGRRNTPDAWFASTGSHSV